MCACHKNCIFLNNKEAYCHQHSSLEDEEERVEVEDMCVDQHVLIHTHYERPGRKTLKTISPDTLKIKIGEYVDRLLYE